MFPRKKKKKQFAGPKAKKYQKVVPHLKPGGAWHYIAKHLVVHDHIPSNPWICSKAELFAKMDEDHHPR